MIEIPMIIMAIENEDDCEFIQRLFLKNEKAMFKMALRIVKEEHTAEDMVLAACEKMIDKISYLRNIDSCKHTPYIISIVRNTSLMYLRKRKRENILLVDNEQVFDWATHEHREIDEDLIIEAEVEEVRSALKRIHRRDRELLESKYFANLSDEKIALQMGIGKDSVRLYLTKARRKLRAAIKGE